MIAGAMWPSGQLLDLGGGGAFLRGAHHPHCERHRHHLLWVRGRPLCLGCTVMAIGIAFSVVWAFVLPPLTPLPWIAVHLILLIPTAMQPYVQKKPFKVVARGLLGLAAGSFWLTGIPTLRVWASAPLVVLAMTLAFGVGYLVLMRLRQRWTRDPCDGCPHGRYPTCDWNLPRLLAAAPDEDLVIAIRSHLLDARAVTSSSSR